MPNEDGMTRVLVLVLSAALEPWATIEREGQRATWCAADLPEAPVFYYYGLAGASPAYWASRVTAKGLRVAGQERARARFLARVGRWSASRPVSIDGTRITTRVPESYDNTSAKFRAALQYVVSTMEFDYLLRTNTSSYVHRPLLSEQVGALPRQGYYGGSLVPGDPPWVSGTGILMSRDVAELGAADDSWEYDVVDDVAMGRVAHRAGIEPRELPRVDVESPEQRIDPEELRGCFMVRCKSPVSRELDVPIMRKVHELYTGSDSGSGGA
jgi:hypothetical protein